MRTYEFINRIAKENGNNRYSISICHETFSVNQFVSFGSVTEPVKEVFQVHYCWKNAKRSMFNLTLKPTRTLEESLKLMDKKIKDLEEKIK